MYVHKAELLNQLNEEIRAIYNGQTIFFTADWLTHALPLPNEQTTQFKQKINVNCYITGGTC